MPLSFLMDDPKYGAESGVLYIVATPIGNLGDITLRALDVLRTSDYIAAEDTRKTARLLSYYQIESRRLISCHEHNEAERVTQLVEKLKSGKSVALVSDAGTPSVSDPGYRLTTGAVSSGIPVVPIPGASAAVAALSASGLPSDRFSFIGFLPKKKGRRDKLLQLLNNREETLIFYESPRRLISALDAICAQMGDRYAVVAREITKLHEEILRGRISDLLSDLKRRDSIKGEITLLVSGSPEDSGDEIEEPDDSEIKELILKEDASTSRLAGILARRYNKSKSEMYQKILNIRSKMAESGNQARKGDWHG